MSEVQAIVFRLPFVDLDMGGVVERFQQHVFVLIGIPALHEIFPNPLFTVHSFSSNKKPVFIHKLLVDEGVDKHEVPEIFPDPEDVIQPLSRFFQARDALQEPVSSQLRSFMF